MTLRPTVRAMRAAGVTLAAIVGLLTIADAKMKVETKKDEAFSFKGLRTWAWHPDGAGEVKMMLTPDDDAKGMQARFEPVIKDAVVREMTAKQFVTAEAGKTPDVYVMYYVLISTSTNRQVMYQNVSAEVAWQIPSFYQATQNFKVIEEGSLILDVSSPATKALVWRGVAQAEINRERTPAQRDARLRDAISSLLDKFPKTT